MLGAEGYVDPASPVVAAHLGHLLWFTLLATTLLAVLLFAWRPWSTKLAGLAPVSEPAAFRVLRLGTSALWFVVGLTALRATTALGVPGHALPASLEGAPAPLRWLGRHVVDRWLAHGTWAAVATVAVGCGLGLWLAVASGGRPARIASSVSVVVALGWWLASGLGGLLGQGGWATGAGGAAPWLAAAGVLLSAGAERWRDERLALHRRRWVGLALALLGLAQALGLRSAWSPGAENPVGRFAARAANATSWSWLASELRSTARSAADHPGAWNLAVVLVLLASAAGVALGGARLRRVAASTYALAALGAWLAVAGTGVQLPGSLGLGALPASALLVGAVAFTPGGEVAAIALPPVVTRATACVAVAALLVGAVLGAAAAAWPGADRDLAMSGGLSAASLTGERPPPILEQHLDGRPFSLADLHGKVAAVIFMDPICDTDCSALARELDAAVSTLSTDVVPVVVNLNPAHASASAMRRFASREGLERPPWVLLTGSPKQIRETAAAWKVSWAQPPRGGMLLHDDPIYVLAPSGRITTAWEAPPDESGGVASRSAVAAIAEALRSAGGR